MKLPDGHPTPQLARATWVDLNGPWRFAFDDDDRGLTEGWHEGKGPLDREIVVPFPPESPASGIDDTTPHHLLWYSRTLPLTRGAAEQDRWVLHFGAVDHDARVWVNGRLAVEHHGGHTPFRADVTDLLEDGPDQLVVVRAEDRIEAVEQPRGKQAWRPDPHAVWYERTSGIWQSVWIERVAAQHIAYLTWRTEPERGLVFAEVTLATPPRSDTTVRVTLRHHDEMLAQVDSRCTMLRTTIALDIPQARNGQEAHDILWSPEHPNLLDATVEVSQAGELHDTAYSYVGLRAVGTADGRFQLNGRPYFLRMVLEQGYWPATHLATPDDGALAREVTLIKSLGFNGARLHQKVEDPRFLYWCDRLGLAVFAEMPSAYAFSADMAAQITAEWTEQVLRDRSHPCVVAWVPMNESWGVRWITADPRQRSLLGALYHLTHALDGTRPVISNDGWENVESDMIGIHDYSPDPSELAARYGTPEAVAATLSGAGPGQAPVLAEHGAYAGQPVLVTEFGGIGLGPDADHSHFAYSTAPDGRQLAARVAAQVAALSSSSLAGFCYTQLTDTAQEVNGLLTADRAPKAPVELLRAAITTGRMPPAHALPEAHLAEKETP
jgi:beta-galactosidase/beta-glucuronidase